jgi:hypothetical protein
MEFDRTLISNLRNSLSFLNRSLLLACNTLMKGKLLSEKPDYVRETEIFTEFFRNVLGEAKAIEKFRVKVLKPLYDEIYSDLLSKVIDDGKVQDSFIKEGISFKFGSYSLPISKIYSTVLELMEQDKKMKVIHPPKIILAFYAVMFYAVEKEESKEALDMIAVNMNLMIETIEDMTKPPPQDGGNVIKDAFKKLNPAKMMEMMGSMNKDPRANAQMKQMFGKMQEAFGADDPMTALGDMIKESSRKMAEEMEGKNEVEEEVSSPAEDASGED